MSAHNDLLRTRLSGTRGSFSLDVSFEAPLKGLTAIFGPSGSGKTTILRAIAGLSRLSGLIEVGREIWQDDAASTFWKPHERAVGFVFQEASLFPHLSVRKNLLYGLRRAPRGASGPALEEVIRLLDLGRLLERAPGGLSGGERQRVAVGRALLSRPRLLLMDEPLSALDRNSKEKILPYLEALQHELAIPVLYVSHDVAEVTRLAQRLILVADGRKVAEGPVEGILERLDLRPATGRFEAGVVLRAHVVCHDERYGLTRLDHHGQRIVIPLIETPVSEAVRLRVRARDVALARSAPREISIRNILQGTIVEIVEERETAFAETLIDIGGGRLRARITREAVADLELAVGTPVFALIKSIAFDGRSIVTPQIVPAPRSSAP